MRIPVGNETLYILLFADNQVTTATDMDDATYMLRKLFEEYKRWDLTINVSKKYLVIGENDVSDLKIETEIIRGRKTFKYLGVTFISDGKTAEEIKNHSIVEIITTYGSEIWVLNKRDEDKLLALDMDYWK